MKVKIGRGKVKIVKHRSKKKKKKKTKLGRRKWTWRGVLGNSSLSTLHFSPPVSLSLIESGLAKE